MPTYFWFFLKQFRGSVTFWCGSGSEHLTNGSGSGRPKNMRIRIRIPDTVYKVLQDRYQGVPYITGWMNTVAQLDSILTSCHYLGWIRIPVLELTSCLSTTWGCLRPLYSSVIDSRTDSPATASYSSRRGRKTAPVYERRNRETTRKGPAAAAVDSPFRGDHRSLALAQSLSSLTVQGGGGDGTKNGALDHESVVANSPPGNMEVLSAAALDASSQSGRRPPMETGPKIQPGSSSSSGSQMRSGGPSQQSEAKGKENTPQLDVHGWDKLYRRFRKFSVKYRTDVWVKT